MRLYRIRFKAGETNVQKWARTRLHVQDITQQAWEWHGVDENDVEVQIVEFELSRAGVVNCLNNNATTW
jgi:hypothetical protein